MKSQGSNRRRMIAFFLTIAVIGLGGYWFSTMRQPNLLLRPNEEDSTGQLNKFARNLSVLEDATELTVLSLNSNQSGTTGFHGYPIVGQAKIKGADKKLLLAALEQAITDPSAHRVLCFDPHHGLRAQSNGQTVDFVICFMCTQFGVFTSPTQADHDAGSGTIGPAPEKFMNKMLRQAGAKFDPEYSPI